MLTNTDIALVRLYYENFGLGVEEISAALAQSKPVVSSLISEYNMVAPAEAKLRDDKRKALVERDLDKQLALEPYFIRAEVTILSKIFDVANDVSTDQLDAAQKLSMCSKALKDLKSVSVQAKMDDAAGAAGVTVQILNSL